MKKMLVLIGIALLLWSTAAYAYTSGSTGADGPFSPTANTVVTLPSNGVLNYTTINIPSGVTVTFQKNAANTPVYLLATGNVTIDGTISVNGGNATTTDTGKGGPGGFDGAYGGGYLTTGGKGLGPGGGNPGRNVGNEGGGAGGGGFGFNGNNGTAGNWGIGGSFYGNVKLLPIIGGSGGGGGGGRNDRDGKPGSGGAGAIVIASSGTITVNGSITANGGSCAWDWPGGGGGSGGAIKLAATTVAGNGSISAVYGTGGNWGGNGGLGRIRIEAENNYRTVSTNPAYSYGLPGNIFVSNTPSLTITSIGGTAPPASPTANYNQPDILLPSTTTNPVTINLSAANIPVATTVKVWIIPQYGDGTSVNTGLTGTDQSSTGTANVNLSTTYSNIVTAEATFTIVAFNYEGEEIDKVRVATRLGGKSEITYIAKSGKEFKGELVAALVK